MQGKTAAVCLKETASTILKIRGTLTKANVKSESKKESFKQQQN